MTNHQRPWDPGLQPERTSLAWRRFTLASAAVGLLVVRLGLRAADRQVPVALGVAIVLLAGTLGVATHRRSRTQARHLHERAHSAGGAALAAAATFTAGLALLGMGLVWLRV